MSPTPADLADAASKAGLVRASIVLHAVGHPGEATGFSATVEPDAPLSPASMIKVPLAAALTAHWASEELQPGDRIRVEPANMTANDAESPLVPGYDTTLEEAAMLMLTRSDNVATNVLIDAVGRDRANDYLHALGLQATAIRRKLSGSLPLIADPEATGRNAHPAKDAATLFSAIATRAIPGAEWLHAALAAQMWTDKLSPGLQPGDRFAHKTGETDEVSHDGGILETAEGARYVLVVYTALPSGPASDARFAEFMRLLRPLL